ncbi:MAG TPA: hypothetical protein P5307_09115 [Pirellulaceae bacterium]|nr:hypothetical protein [Planctomycetales bacterium]MCB9937278.1 hypothetical protein [Planctomycetaceae bacterium]HRX79207.1 hypothetical protein [Pirellulaceae bacterium]
MAADLIPPLWKVPQVFRDRMGEQVGRQRAMIADGELLLVLHAPPKPNENQRHGRFFWRDAEGQWSSKDRGTGLNALNKHLDEYEELIAELDRLEEQATSSGEYFAILEQLSPVQRAATNLHHVLQEAREKCPDFRELINLRDRAYGIERTAELLLAEVKNALDVAVAKRAEEQAASSHQMSIASHRLNKLAAFFFPVATLMAIFGANLRHGLEDVWPPIPMVAVLVLGLVMGAVLAMFVTRKSAE